MAAWDQHTGRAEFVQHGAGEGMSMQKRLCCHSGRSSCSVRDGGAPELPAAHEVGTVLLGGR